jgi:hypothetical protein
VKVDSYASERVEGSRFVEYAFIPDMELSLWTGLHVQDEITLCDPLVCRSLRNERENKFMSSQPLS